MKIYLSLVTYTAILIATFCVRSAAGFLQAGPPENLPGIPVDLDLPD